MLEKLRHRSNEESGFTLVELLVVMLILGILAAIAIPTFFNQRDKAKDSSAKEAVRTAQTAMETYATDNDNDYAGATSAILHNIEPTIDADPLVTKVSYPGSGALYKLGVVSDTTTEFTLIKNDDGSTTFGCTRPGEGGCPTGGNWAG